MIIRFNIQQWRVLVCLVFGVTILSCTTKKEIFYLQDLDERADEKINYTNPKIQPNDVLRINVGALNPASAIPYNKSASAGAGVNPNLLLLDGYLVSENLTINFPILGVLSVEGMTTQEFASQLRQLLIDGGHLKSPTIDVRLVNAKVTVLGEVNSPGTFSFTEQNITLLQALGYAGDLTINGVREDVVVMRDENGIRKVAHIDLTSGAWLEGPYYFVQPNDLIIVNQNSPKVKSAGFVGNVGTLISVISIVFSTVVLISR